MNGDRSYTGRLFVLRQLDTGTILSIESVFEQTYDKADETKRSDTNDQKGMAKAYP